MISNASYPSVLQAEIPHKHAAPARGSFTRPLCFYSTLSVTLSLFNHCHSNMAFTPDDTFLVSSATALGMAENLIIVLNSIMGNLPESELRRVRSAMEHSVRVADDILYNAALTSTFDVLTLNDGMYTNIRF